MGEITEKEWFCLKAYITDLIKEMRNERNEIICDEYNEYTIKELEVLQEKLLQVINSLSD